jgi:predicted transposase/invertase (TIGR01784 family)
MDYDISRNRFVSPLSDLVFKKIFGDARNADILSDLLANILKLPKDEYAGIEFQDTHLNPETEDGKLAVLDVKVRTKSGKVVNIEVQVLRAKAMRLRLLYYVTKMFVEQMSKGSDYGTIKRVISIVIADYNLMSEETGYHNVYRLLNENSHKAFSDLLEIHTLELKKLPEIGEDSGLVNWMRFLKAKTEGEFLMVAKTNPMIQKAWGYVREMSADERAHLQAEINDMAEHDLVSLDVEYYEEEAREKGQSLVTHLREMGFTEKQIAIVLCHDFETKREEARAEERQRVETNLRAMGFTEVQIHQALRNS